MSGSCHFDRASNVEIAVECKIFAIVIFLNCSRVLQFEAHSRHYRGALTQKKSFVVICTTFRFDFHVGWKNQNKQSIINSSLDTCRNDMNQTLVQLKIIWNSFGLTEGQGIGLIQIILDIYRAVGNLSKRLKSISVHTPFFWPRSKVRLYLMNLHIWGCPKLFGHTQKILKVVEKVWMHSIYFEQADVLQLWMNYYAWKCGLLDLTVCDLIWVIGTYYCNWKNQNPGGRFGATS